MTPGQTFYEAWCDAMPTIASPPWGIISDAKRAAFEAGAAAVLVNRGA